MTFEAKYGGRCGGCDEQIRPGDLCTYSAEVLVHDDCAAAAERSEREEGKAVRPVCDRCFMETSVTGKCGCDE